MKKSKNNIPILLQSFGFKNKIPNNSDFMFDVRCLKNPFWDKKLKNLNGKSKKVITFFETDKQTNDMRKSIQKFLEKWIPTFLSMNRELITISIGCTGGKHRSVYLTEVLYKLLSVKYKCVASASLSAVNTKFL